MTTRSVEAAARVPAARPPGVEEFDAGAVWRVPGQVAMRPESFGALLYHFGTRRLSFLKDPRLAEAVARLDGGRTALEACRATEPAGVPAQVLAGLATLAATGMLERVPAAAPAGASGAGQIVPAGPAGAHRPGGAGSAVARRGMPLADRFASGLAAPICLTWELTYACNLACVHCLSSSGRRDPGELSTAECLRVIEELQAMQVFYVNIGGGEPTVRPDFWDIVDYATDHRVGVKFSTNGVRITRARAARLARNDYVDVQISLDGATAPVNDAVRGQGSHALAVAAMERLAEAGVTGFKISVVATRHNIGQLDAFKALADRYAATLRITRLRPAGRGADSWADLHPMPGQQRVLYDWLLAHGEGVLTGDSFFHLAGYGQALPGLNLCGAGRVVCLIDPVGDVYACPFAIHDRFRAGTVRDPGGFWRVWADSELFSELRRPQTGGACSSCSAYDTCRGGCMAAKFFTGLPLDGPDPECVRGNAEPALAAVAAGPDAALAVPRPDRDHSRTAGRGRGRGVPVVIGRTPPSPRTAVSACVADPLAGFDAAVPDGEVPGGRVPAGQTRLHEEH
ncbi:MAG TPA: mycofactocin radical SAM maturase [Kineosporiaceae bacterium]